MTAGGGNAGLHKKWLERKLEIEVGKVQAKLLSKGLSVPTPDPEALEANVRLAQAHLPKLYIDLYGRNPNGTVKPPSDQPNRSGSSHQFTLVHRLEKMLNPAALTPLPDDIVAAHGLPLSYSYSASMAGYYGPHEGRGVGEPAARQFGWHGMQPSHPYTMQQQLATYGSCPPPAQLPPNAQHRYTSPWCGGANPSGPSVMSTASGWTGVGTVGVSVHGSTIHPSFSGGVGPTEAMGEMVAAMAGRGGGANIIGGGGLSAGMAMCAAASFRTARGVPTPPQPAHSHPHIRPDLVGADARIDDALMEVERVVMPANGMPPRDRVLFLARVANPYFSLPASRDTHLLGPGGEGAGRTRKELFKRVGSRRVTSFHADVESAKHVRPPLQAANCMSRRPHGDMSPRDGPRSNPTARPTTVIMTSRTSSPSTSQHEDNTVLPPLRPPISHTHSMGRRSIGPGSEPSSPPTPGPTASGGLFRGVSMRDGSPPPGLPTLGSPGHSSSHRRSGSQVGSFSGGLSGQHSRRQSHLDGLATRLSAATPVSGIGSGGARMSDDSLSLGATQSSIGGAGRESMNGPMRAALSSRSSMVAIWGAAAEARAAELEAAAAAAAAAQAAAEAEAAVAAAEEAARLELAAAEAAEAAAVAAEAAAAAEFEAQAAAVEAETAGLSPESSVRALLAAQVAEAQADASAGPTHVTHHLHHHQQQQQQQQQPPEHHHEHHHHHLHHHHHHHHQHSQNSEGAVSSAASSAAVAVVPSGMDSGRASLKGSPMVSTSGEREGGAGPGWLP